MRIAFVTSYDSRDVNNWSGLGYHMARGLENQGVVLIRVNCFVQIPFWQKVLKKLVRVLLKKTWQPERESRHLKKMAARVSTQLAGKVYDLILVAGSLPVSFLNAHKPVVFFTDATYEGLMNLYLHDRSLCNRSRRNGNRAEQLAIQKAALIVYTSAWAMRSAIDTYKADPKKISVLPFGSNLPINNTLAYIQARIQQRWYSNSINFLFVGVDWKRKGAGIAIETVSKLTEAGVKATLTIVGAVVPIGMRLPSFVTYYPFISKASEAGVQLLHELFSRANFFLLPTAADCTPVVFSEAAGYGLPVITTTVGGCPSIVINGETGYCIDPKDYVAEAVTKLLLLTGNRRLYEQMSLHAFAHYKAALNWEVTSRSLTSIMSLFNNNREVASLSLA